MESLSNDKTKELQLIEIELLRVFIESCQKLSLKYYVIGGTLLGTVRHNGFIPWDDDVDVAMCRDDYEKWLKEAPKLIDSDKYFIQNNHSDRYFPANFTKLRKNESTFIELPVKKLDIHHGIFIDIFPLDYYPEKNLLFLILKRGFLPVKLIEHIALKAFLIIKGLV